MLQVVYERDFRLMRVVQPDASGHVGKEYWVVYATKNFPEEPAVFEKIEDATKWIELKAGLRQHQWAESIHPASGNKAT